MNCRTPERNYFYLLNPETCRILELDGEGSGYGSGSHPAPGAGLGLSPECWVCCSSFHCTDTHSPEHVGYAAGWGRRRERTGLFPLCSCSVLLQVLSGCLPSLCQSLQVSLGLGVPLCHGFPSEGKPHNKNLFSQLLKAELSGHLYPVIPVP